MNEVNFENINNNAQYQSFKAAIEAHAKEYSFNIESMLFPQLTTEQQKLWRKEIEQACISGGDTGVSLARDFTKKDAFIEKACDAYCEVCGHYPHTTPKHICRQACDYYKDFRNHMKGE